MNQFSMNKLSKKDIRVFNDSKDLCIDLIKKYAWRYNGQNYFNAIGASVAASVVSNINSITNSTKELQGHFLFPDEINPEKLSEFLIAFRGYEVDKEALTYFISRHLLKEINELYKNIQQGIVYVSQYNHQNKKLQQKVEDRLNSGIKQIRSYKGYNGRTDLT